MKAPRLSSALLALTGSLLLAVPVTAILVPGATDGRVLHNAAFPKLGSKFACVTTQRYSPDYRLVLNVTSHNSVAEADALIAEEGLADRASARVVSPRFGRNKLLAIKSSLERRDPAYSPATFAVIENFNHPTPMSGPCPVVWIQVNKPNPSTIGPDGTLVEPDQPPEYYRQVRWAKAEQKRYGRERVRFKPGRWIFPAKL